MPKISVKGLDDLEKRLRDNVTMNDVKRVVRQNGSELQRGIHEDADFTRGYATGTIKRSIILELEDGGLKAVTGSIDPVLNPVSSMPATKYSPYVEYGTRFMTAQPFVRPAYIIQKAKFKKDMQKLVR